jgi:hypothetical protein
MPKSLAVASKRRLRAGVSLTETGIFVRAEAIFFMFLFHKKQPSQKASKACRPKKTSPQRAILTRKLCSTCEAAGMLPARDGHLAFRVPDGVTFAWIAERVK